MKLLKIKDNSQQKKESFSQIKNLTSKIADKTLEQLEREGVFIFPEIVRDAEDITQDQMILQSVNDTYRTSNVMGFLGCGDERLIIESRFCGDGEDFFFQYLLDKVLDFPNIVDMETDANHNNQLFNFLLFLFPHYLKTAMRKGLFKKYIRCRYNDENVKGTIDVARHIENNTPFVGNVAYSQREFSYDNSLMELVRHTIEFIKRKPYGNKLLNKVKDEVKMVVDATRSYEPYDRQKIIEQNKKNAVRHAYFKEYLALQRLCLLILRHQKHQIGTGSKQIYGILFDGAWLWEEYVNSLVEDIFYHPMNKGGKGAQRLFDGNVGLIYPDFIGRNSEIRMIADAKYKPIDNIGNRDYLQVLAYMFRFDAKTGYYLYPEVGEADDLKLRMNRGSTYEANVSPRDDICVIKHGLKIPVDTPDYTSFIRKMKFSEQEFVSVFLRNSMCEIADMQRILEFAVKWNDKINDRNINYIELVDHYMADDCEALGFEMDCGHAFSEKYGNAAHDVNALERIVDQVTDIPLLGSAIYSRWRYFNHWAYSSEEILEPKNRAWFTIALKHLNELAADQLKHMETQKISK